MTFSIFSAFTLLMCAAFAEQTARVIHLPSKVLYVLACVGGALTLVLNIESSLSNISRKTFILMAQAYSFIAVLLNVFVLVFVVQQPEGITKATFMTAGLFLFFLVGALLSLLRLKTLIGS